MSRIITYKEGCYSQIKLTSGERIMLSCAEMGATIFKMRFFGLVPDSKIGEWKQDDVARFMLLFGGGSPNQTPFKRTVDKLTSFDSIEQLNDFLRNGNRVSDRVTAKPVDNGVDFAHAAANFLIAADAYKAALDEDPSCKVALDAAVAERADAIAANPAFKAAYDFGVNSPAYNNAIETALLADPARRAAYIAYSAALDAAFRGKKKT